MLVKLNNKNFEEEVLNKEGFVLVDFYAEWCGPCRMLSPVMIEIASERNDLIVGKVNVDDDGDLAYKYDVSSIPTMIVFKDGKEYKRMVGFRSKAAILAEIKK